MEFNPRVDGMIGIVFLLVSFSGVVSNTFFIKVLVKQLRQMKHKVVLLLLLQLSIADLVTCLLPSSACAMALICNRSLSISPHLIAVFGFLLSAMPIAALYIICIMSVGRLFAVYWSLTYRLMFRPRLVMAMCSIGWMCSILYSLTPFFLGANYAYSRPTGTITYSLMQTPEHKQVEQILMFITVTVIDLPFASTCCCCVAVLVKLVRDRLKRFGVSYSIYQKKVANKAISTTSFIICSFILCYTPGAILRFLFFLKHMNLISHPLYPTTESGKVMFLYIFFLINCFFMTLNSALNPLIYYANRSSRSRYSTQGGTSRADILLQRRRTPDTTGTITECVAEVNLSRAGPGGIRLQVQQLPSFTA